MRSSARLSWNKQAKCWSMRHNALKLHMQIEKNLQSRRTPTRNLCKTTQINGCHFSFFFSFFLLAATLLFYVLDGLTKPLLARLSLLCHCEPNVYHGDRQHGPIRHRINCYSGQVCNLPYLIYVIFRCHATGLHLQFTFFCFRVSALTDQECTHKVVDLGLIYNFCFASSLICCPTKH